MHVWLAVNHSTSINSGKWVRYSKRIAWASELGSCQSNLLNSVGYEPLQKSKDLLKDCFKNVNIHVIIMEFIDSYQNVYFLLFQSFRTIVLKRLYKNILFLLYVFVRDAIKFLTLFSAFFLFFMHLCDII